jgi:glycosyltransferase involved in cell wall biosynthesis
MIRSVKISAIVITFNEEQKIERCLKSLAWVDEIVIVDSFSTDRTVEICKRYTEKVYQHPWPHSFSGQRAVAVNYTTHDWILALDADEVVTVELQKEIIDVFSNGPQADLFMIPRKEYFAGKWIKAGGWYPQYKTILYRKSMGEWTGLIHMKVLTRGTTGHLKNPILHDGYTGFKIFMDKFNYYSSVEAENDYIHHKKRFSLVRALFKPIERFWGRFIRHRGYRDGIHGFYMAAVIAINYFLRELKLYEFEYRERHRNDWDEEYQRTAVGVSPDFDDESDRDKKES